MSVGEVGVRRGERRIERDSLREEGDRALERFGTSPIELEPAEQVRVVRLEVFSGFPLDARTLRGREFRLKSSRHVHRHLALDREYVRELAIVCLRPDMSVGRRI